MKTKTTFSKVKIGDKFHCNGNEYLKKTSRAAILLSYNRVFYFGMNEVVTI